MKQKFFLLNLKLSGIKNIENEVSIDFYKKSIGKDFSVDGYNVKAIYGENGSGKTAIVSAVNLVKLLCLEEDYLSDASNQRYLNEIINKKTQAFSCSFEFVHLTGDIVESVYSYSIRIEKLTSGKYGISYENLSKRSRTATFYSTIYECCDRELKSIQCSDESKEVFKIKTANLLEKSTFLSLSFKLLPLTPDSGVTDDLLTAFFWSLSIRCYMDASDQHDLYFLSETIRELKDADKVLNDFETYAGVRDRQVLKPLFGEYERRVRQLEGFLKLFKTDLVKIEIEKKENVEYYDCSLVMKYPEYSVDKEFESTGIKKLIDLFDYLNAAAEGAIVFIDEMDANINDIYLCKLIEFFMEYGEGQLCFTTHNTSPMSVLRRNKKSIDFLSNDNRVIPWKTNGNYSPESLYRAGMIEYLPFNVESTDFVGILGGQDE